MDTDVLVVGAGPTGLMLANQLARRGVRTTIIDQHAGPALQSRALGVQARTLEIYQHLGIAQRALDLGKRAVGASMWAQGQRMARVPLGDIGQNLSPYPFLLILGQDDNELLLGEALQRYKITVQWNTRLVALTQSEDQVACTIEQPDGTQRIVCARWVAGCDGAHSAVRELNAIAFQGAPYEHVFFVADTIATGQMVPDELNVYLWPKGFHLFFPLRGTDHWRVVGIVPAALRGKDNLRFDDVVPSLRGEAGASLSFGECKWFSTYRIHHRRASKFRDRRCFLLGDAAHVHSPVGAQGMNTGLQDAYNLGWKLALVVAGRAREGLLDSYAGERMPVADRLLSTTDRGFSLVVSDSKLAGFFRMHILPRVLAAGMRVERIRRRAFFTISQIGIRYRDGPLSQNRTDPGTTGLHAGDRFPWLHLERAAGTAATDLFSELDDTRFNLIVIGQAAQAVDIPELEGLLQVIVVADSPNNDRELARAGIARPSYYLLRPDGHIGLAGSQLEAEAIRRYARERLELTATPANVVSLPNESTRTY